MTDSIKQVLLRIAPMTYGPSMLFGLGEGAMVPMIPIIAAQLGADIATAGLVASMLIVGRMIGNLPAGWLVSRFGERITMIWAAVLGLFAITALALSSTLAIFTLCIFLIGLTDAAFALARHAFMTTRVPLYFRARALALLGGSYRLGIFVGPFIAVLLIALTGTEYSTAWLFAVIFVGIVALVTLGPDPETQFDELTLGAHQHEVPLDEVDTAPLNAEDMNVDRDEHLTGDHAELSSAARSQGERVEEPVLSGAAREDNPGVFRTMYLYRGVLARLGVAAAALAAVRAARQVILPLWGVSIGLDAQTIAIVIGVSGAIDFALFYVSGQIMDRFGRLWAVLPAMLMMGIGFTALSFTHDLEHAGVWFAILASVIALGNGVSSGILMTLGADVAPIRNPAPFLGSWRLLNDAGGAVAPLLFSAIVAVAAIGVGTGLMGAIAFVGALGFARWVPRFVKR